MIHRYTILITGATGFCGSYLSKYFKNKNKEIQVYTTSRKKQSNSNHIQHDLSIPVPTNLFPKKIDCIIHCAANLEQHNTEFTVINENLKTSFNICQYAIKAKCQYFINFSSIMVYGKTKNDHPISEDSQTFPSTVYGLSKLLVENMINGVLTNLMNVVNLRIGSVIFENIPKRYFLYRFKESFLKGESITLINPDKTRFSFIDLQDIAKICELLINTKNTGTFNIVNDECPNLRQTTQEIKKYYDSPTVIKEIVRKSEEFPFRFTNKKIKKLVKIKFKSYKDSFRDIFSKDDV